MNPVVAFLRFFRVVIPHVIALPAVVVFRSRWGVNHVTWIRFIIGMVLSFPIMLASGLVLGDEVMSPKIKHELNYSYGFMFLFGIVSSVFFVAGRISRAMRPPSGLSNSVGWVRFLPEGKFWQMVPSLALVSLAVADHYYWKALRPLSALGAYYGVMMAFDYFKACNYTRRMHVGVNDAKILSNEVTPPSSSRKNDNPAGSGEGSTGELVRIYGRNSRR